MQQTLLKFCLFVLYGEKVCMHNTGLLLFLKQNENCLQENQQCSDYLATRP